MPAIIRDNLAASVYVFSPKSDAEGSCMPVVECTQEIIASGLGVETFFSEYNHVPYAPGEIERLREIGCGAKILTFHTNQLSWNRDGLEAEIALAASLGGSVLVVHPATFGLERCDDPPSPSVLRDICKLALDSGIRLAFENMGRTGVEMLRLGLDIIGTDPDSTGMGVCIDVGHANRSTPLDGLYAQDYLREFRDIILEVHINDNLGGEDLHMPPGEGSIDWDAVLPELRVLPEKAVLCIELARPEGDPMDALHRSCEFLCGKG